MPSTGPPRVTDRGRLLLERVKDLAELDELSRRSSTATAGWW